MSHLKRSNANEVYKDPFYLKINIKESQQQSIYLDRNNLKGPGEVIPHRHRKKKNTDRNYKSLYLLPTQKDGKRSQ